MLTNAVVRRSLAAAVTALAALTLMGNGVHAATVAFSQKPPPGVSASS